MAEPYQPIPCALHERLEFAVLRRQRLRLRYRTEAGEVEAVVLPTDVATRAGAEWLSFQAESGANQVIRLDAIVSARPA
ncbi:Rof transcriptional antiterminator [Sulfuritortus calidifontis]|uniref:Rof transcriptional antiterminator n=1 Tax=Sulfuritortus calidifontis TaxID=1914471 RepID=A0A4R3JWE6_9PROT|nr:transcriptional antiterminator, Rof [Sulfuritortus calidifontis]TCS71465.1 Rof transcriptional antiterminator [Sulfuritortus calidifontis]